MNPKKFLLTGGTIFILLAILGFVGVVGPTAKSSILGNAWWFSSGANWIHLIAGLIMLAAAIAFTSRTLVIVIGVSALALAIVSLFKDNFLGISLEGMDTLFYFLIAIWAYLSKKEDSNAII
ncbi:MAG: hypothetical protein CEN90_93 [Parcubacteria group bacterium Licking1014_17]|nr:MAG: hypothetical protein CEN90_93 [Parcubacteria group bacterium Licking1014_17]